MMDFLLRIMNIIERVRTSSSVSDVAMIGFGILLVFGFVNCILGYRLLRFWMMIFGFVIGAGLGLGAAFTMGYRDRFTMIAAAVGVGIVLAVIAFMSYKVGIFVLGAGLGLGVGVYVLHPTTSLTFFLCILLGVVLGTLAMKWAREVIIVGTSILGGAMAGVSLAKLGGLPDIPYGIVLSVAFAVLGILIQFATNRKKYEDYEDDEDYEEDSRSRRREREQERPVRHSGRNRSDRRSSSRRYDDDYGEDEYIPRPRRRSSASGNPAETDRYASEHVQRTAGSGKKRRSDYDYRIDDQAPEYEKTVEYRPGRKPAQELDLPLESFDREEKYGQRADFADTDVYEDDYDYEEPIDEELLDEEILKEMMEEEDRKTDLFWRKISGRRNREKKQNGKRSKN